MDSTRSYPSSDVTAPVNKSLELSTLLKPISALTGAFFQIPQLQVNFWNKILLSKIPILAGTLGVIIFAATIMFFIRKKRVLLTYLTIVSGLSLIFMFVHAGGMRHKGFVILAFLFNLWISNDYKEEKLINKQIFSEETLKKLLTVILLIQIIASPVAAYYELKYDFSSGKKVAKYLKDNNLDNEFIATHMSFATSSILPYFKNKKFFCIVYNSPCSFMTWNKNYSKNGNLGDDEIISRVTDRKK